MFNSDITLNIFRPPFIALNVFWPNNWENLIIAMRTSTPVGILKFDDVSGSLMNEELGQTYIFECIQCLECLLGQLDCVNYIT